MGACSAVLDAIAAFWDYLASVQPLPLAIAIGCHIAKTMCTSRAWRNVLAAAYPDDARPLALRSTRAYIAGVGVNAIFPARAGDVVRLTMAHRAVKGATYTTLVSSSLVLAIVDVACALALFAWAMTQGVLPSFDVLPSLPSFDFAWFLEHDQVGADRAARASCSASSRSRSGSASNVAEFQRARRPGVHGRPHARSAGSARSSLWQLADWALRLATIWFMLDAFGIDQSLRNVLLVQASQSLATLVPVSPGGVGTEQAFLVYTLRGQAPRSALLAFSVGMRLTLTAVNVVLGFTAILLTLRTLRFRSLPRPADGRGRWQARTSPARRCGGAGRRPTGRSSPAAREPPRAPPATRRGSGRPSRSAAGSPAAATARCRRACRRSTRTRACRASAGDG